MTGGSKAEPPSEAFQAGTLAYCTYPVNPFRCSQGISLADSGPMLTSGKLSLRAIFGYEDDRDRAVDLCLRASHPDLDVAVRG